MILETTKMKNQSVAPECLLRLFLALVFLSAGIFRIFNPIEVAAEFNNLRLPLFFSWFVIIFEIIAGLGLLVNKYTKIIYYLLASFIIFAFFWVFAVNGLELVKNFKEVFAFNLNPTDILLHFVFLLIIVSLIIRNK